MLNSELRATIFLNLIPEIGPARFQILMQKFEKAAEAAEAGPSEWLGLSDFSENLIEKISNNYELNKKVADEEYKEIDKLNIKLLYWNGEDYPPLLRDIFNPPPLLYIKGKLSLLSDPAVAIVGSRRCSPYGERVARMLARELAQAGLTTGSGLARGIDTAVHHETLLTKGQTWAVLGHGFKWLYPPENKRLAEQIEKTGALISEFPMGRPAYPGHFPRRNRLISGLSLGTVVVEGTKKSGALITARLAAEQGRDVFAIPGMITRPESQGPLHLIQNGAKPISCIKDIIEELPYEVKNKLNWKENQTQAKRTVERKFEKILMILDDTSLTKEEISNRLNIDLLNLSQLILEMELAGLIKKQLDGTFVNINGP